jgi:release factor glutamine methyltransferase
LRAHPDKPLTPEQITLFRDYVEQRLAGQPIAYIMEHREFWSLKLRVTADTLIPRPETECLVGMVLATLPAAEKLIVADLGTGSGAIALSLAKERPNWHILATDNEWSALEIAQYNCLNLGLTNVSFFYGDWFQAIPSHLRLDVVVSNPPYISEEDPHLKVGDLRFEPSGALASGTDGLKDLKLIIEQAQKYMKPGAWLFLEHGYNQGLAVQTMLQRNGYLNEAGIKDLAGQPRVAMGQVQLYE